MPEIRPFRGLRFDLARAGNPADLVAFAEELGDPEAVARLRAKSRYNVAQLVGDGHAPDSPDRPHAKLRRWLREGRLRRDAEPSFYAVDQTWTGLNGRVAAKGFLGLLRLEDGGAQLRLPHHPQDSGRDVAHLAELQVGLRPVLALYDDPRGELDSLLTSGRSAFPDLVLADGRGVDHRLFPITGVWETQRIIRWMAERPLLIGEGQAIFEAALDHRDARSAQQPLDESKQPWDFVLAHFANATGPGLEVQAVHRIVSRLPAFDLGPFTRTLSESFDLEPLASLRDIAGIAAQLEEASRRAPSLAVLSGGAARRRAGYLAVLRADRVPERLTERLAGRAGPPPLDLVLVNELAVKPSLGLDIAADRLPDGVEPVVGLDAALQRGRDKLVQLVLLFNPPQVRDVRALCDSGGRIPRHCLRLFPAPLAGPVLQDLTAF